ncbi:MAG: serine/threonine-protein kinase [Burkholderiales bacterium]
MKVPERVGEFVASGVLGNGEVSVVYRAYDEKAKRPIAVKTIARNLIEENIKGNLVAHNLRMEAQVMRRLDHPGIVQAYEYGEDDAFIFFAMEYIEGRSLAEHFARDRRFDEADAVNIIAQVLAALEYAHNNAIWHYDLKPSNVLIANDGRVLLADFGVDARDGESAKQVMGAPGYISPERYFGQPADHRADIFSVGTIFYQLLAGYPPFGGTHDAIMHSVCHRNVDVPSRGDPARRWPQYDAVVERALMKRPEERYPSAGAFRAAAVAAYAYPLDDTIPASTAYAPPRREPIADGARSIEPLSAGVPSIANPVSTAPEGWDAAVLGKIEHALAKFVGPIAKVLVKRGAREHAGVDALADALCASLDSPKQREAFLAAIRGTATASRGGPPSQRPTSPPSTIGGVEASLSRDEIDLAIRLLAVHIGPVARVVVSRAAAGNVQRSELYRKLAAEIDNETERDSFLRKAGVLF